MKQEHEMTPGVLVSGDDMSAGDYKARCAVLEAELADHERLQAEAERLQAWCEKLRNLLRHAQPIIRAHAEASHLLDGFRPRRNQWDDLVERIDAALARQGKESN